MNEQIKSNSHNDSAESISELYHQLITPDQARQIDRLLRELGAYDEDSYPYVYALLTTLQFRVMAHMPKATAEAINSSLSEFITKVEALLSALEKQAELNQQKPFRNPSVQKSRTAFVLDWPLNQHYHNKLEASARDLIESIEEVFAYRTRWVLLFFIACITALSMSCRYLLITRLQEQSAQHVQQYKEWKSRIDIETEQFRAKTTANADLWATQQVALRFDKLQPEQYLMAQQLERSSRLVQLPNGTRVWEVRFGKANGFIDSRMDYKDLRSDPEIVLHFQETPGRLMLSATKPTPTSSPDLDKSRVKRP